MTRNDEIALLTELAPVRDEELQEAAATAEARGLLETILATPTPEPRTVRRRPLRRRWLAAPAVAAAAAAAVAVVLLSGGGPGIDPAAAATLKHAAAVARQQRQLIPRPGQFLYTKSVDAYITTVGLADGKSFNALVPHVREVWVAPDSNGRLVETSGKPRFLTELDRERWIAAGRPPLGNTSDSALSETKLSPERPLDLPTDPDTLYAQLEQEAQGNSNGVYPEMFTEVGDALRETASTPAQRAALYEVASRIPGVKLLGTVHDSARREGIAVALDGHDGIRSVLVFDPQTSSLLEEQQIALAGNSFGLPAGEQIGYATYLVQAVVDSKTATP